MKHRRPDPEVQAEAEAFSAEVDEYRAYVTRPRPRPPQPQQPPMIHTCPTRRVFQPRRVLLLLLGLGAVLWIAHIF